jgi:hypothetical protein
MFPVADWIQRTCHLTGADPTEVIALLQGSFPQSAEFLQSIDRVASTLAKDPEAREIALDGTVDPATRISRVRACSAEIAQVLDGYLVEYADRILTGFDIMDATLRELPQFTLSLIELRLRVPAEIPVRQSAVRPGEAALRERVPPESREAFDAGLAEARAAYGLHDEDVRITYLWPLGLIRRAMLMARRSSWSIAARCWIVTTRSR